MTEEHRIEKRDGSGDAVHQRLRKAIEKRERAYLWTPADAINFKPYLLPTIFGDGRALFTLATINQRPRYWVIRACSTWGSGFDRDEATGPDFAEMTDDILTELEESFGRGRCGYSGNSLFWPKYERVRNCKCEECTDRYATARWPTVDDYGGCSWSRTDWPEGFETVLNPLSGRGNLLAA
ncbi:MAG: hypothetical protein DI527_00590 [Chelatococcus sp.]|nr:MAG: hypothetical protein DI527_00590 [Chelatococcus sp.]